jgi:hypothetical protein
MHVKDIGFNAHQLKKAQIAFENDFAPKPAISSENEK